MRACRLFLTGKCLYDQEECYTRLYWEYVAYNSLSKYWYSHKDYTCLSVESLTILYESQLGFFLYSCILNRICNELGPIAVRPAIFEHMSVYFNFRSPTAASTASLLIHPTFRLLPTEQLEVSHKRRTI